MAAEQHHEHRVLLGNVDRGAGALRYAGDLQPDQGSQFTSIAFTAALEEAGMRCSMDDRNRCLDNAFIERLWRSMKYEVVYPQELAGGFAAQRVIDDWMQYYRSGAGAASSGRGGQGVDQAHRGGAAGAQLSDADQRGGHADGEHEAGRRGLQHIHTAHAADGGSSALFRVGWDRAPHVATQATLKNRDNYHDHTDFRTFAPGTSA